MGIKKFESPPIQEAFNEERDPKKQIYTGKNWAIWFYNIIDALAGFASNATIGGGTIRRLGADGQGESGEILSTPAAVALDEGMYQIAWFLHVLIPATTSSKLVVTINLSSAGTNLEFKSADITENLVSTAATGVITAWVDGGTGIDYALDYTSVGAIGVKYELDLVVQAVSQ